MVYFHPMRSSFVDSGDLATVYPSRGGIFDGAVYRFCGGSLPRTIFGAFAVLLALPRIAVFAIPSVILRRARLAIGKRALLAFMRDCVQFFVITRARLINAANWAHLALSYLWPRFHNGDIIHRQVGDVKQRELRGKRATPIRSQAAQECAEGSETRARSPGRTVKPHERAAHSNRCDEIVRTARLNVQKPGIKSPGDNKLTNIQSRSGELADNV